MLLRYAWMASYFMGIGISVAATVAVCVWAGMKADAAFGTGPRGTIAGIVLGFPLAVYSIYHQVRAHLFDGRDEDGKDDS